MLNLKRPGLLTALGLAAGLLPQPARSQMFPPVTYQGFLSDGANPANGVYQMDFHLYDASAGGNLLSADTHLNVAVADGFFTVEMDLATWQFDGGQRWLEIHANGQVLAPRVKITNAPYALFARNIADGSVTTPKLGDLAVTTAKLADDAVTTDKLAAAAVTGPIIADNTVDGWHLIDGSVGADDLANDAVATPKIAGGAVTSDKLALGAVTWFELADDAVTSGKILDATILGADIAAGAVDSLNLAARAVDEIHLNAVAPPAAGQVLMFNGANLAWAAPGGPAGGWSLVGNAETVAGANFVGTTDDVPLEIRVHAERVMRFEPGTDAAAPGSPNLIGGHGQNLVEPNFSGATIAGGGKAAPEHHAVHGSFGTIGGGYDNDAAENATVAGGRGNRAQGRDSFVGGGGQNRAAGQNAVVSGGVSNLAGDPAGALPNGAFATVPGGSDNEAFGDWSFAAGRQAKAHHAGAFVWADSIGAALLSDTDDQFLVRASGGVHLYPGNPANGGLRLLPSGGVANVIAGAFGNHVGVPMVQGATIAGGGEPTAIHEVGGDFGTIGGGQGNRALGLAATVPGGAFNSAVGDYSFAAGRMAGAGHDGSFVWADSRDAGFASAADDQFLIRAGGGVFANARCLITPDAGAAAPAQLDPVALTVQGELTAIFGQSAPVPGSIGVHGKNLGAGKGVLGESVTGTGIEGSGLVGVAGFGNGDDGVAVAGVSANGTAVAGDTTTGWAGWFQGGRGVFARGQVVVRPGAGAVPPAAPDPIGLDVLGQATAIHGECDAVPGSVGVRGKNPLDGRGVLGESSTGTGVEGSGAIGVYGSPNVNAGIGVKGSSQGGLGVEGTSVTDIGVKGTSNNGIGVTGSGSIGVMGSSTGGDGVMGTSQTGNGVEGLGGFTGVRGTAGMLNAIGVYGGAFNGPLASGVYGETTDGHGVFGTSNAGTGVFGYGVTGVEGESLLGSGVAGTSSTGSGVHGTVTSGTGSGVRGVGDGQGATGVLGQSDTGTALSGSTDSGVAVLGVRGARSGVAPPTILPPAVWGDTDSGNGVVGSSSMAGGAGVVGILGATPLGFYSAAVLGGSVDGVGVTGVSNNHIGSYGRSFNSHGVLGVTSANSDTIGVYGEATSGANFSRGLLGRASGAGVGVMGDNTNAAGYAGYFNGRVWVTGSFTATGAKAFTIDHPADPANKYLRHFSIESPEVLNVYAGNVRTDTEGMVVVTLPAYFESINRDFRYQLTVVGQFAQAIVSREIQDNQFEIRTDKPGVKVSWQVSAVRNDAYMRAYPQPAEIDKPDHQRGKYARPELLGQPKEAAIGYTAEMAEQPESALAE